MLTYHAFKTMIDLISISAKKQLMKQLTKLNRDMRVRGGAEKFVRLII